jgi:hypothetical protein
VSLAARLPRGIMLQGGTNTGKSLSDVCDVTPKLQNPSQRFCHQETKFLTDVRFLGSVALPWDMQVSGSYQNRPSLGNSVTGASYGASANYVVSNALIAPSLGRNLAAGPNANVTINLIEPGTEYPGRVNQLDIRFAKTVRMRQSRLKAMVDLYNALHGQGVTAWNNNYGTNGATWLYPQAILIGRFLKVAAQFNF